MTFTTDHNTNKSPSARCYSKIDRLCIASVKSTTNPQQLQSCTTNPKRLDLSRCCGFVVDSTINLRVQQIKAMEFGFQLVVDKSTTG